MPKFFLIVVIGLFSCHQSTVTKHRIVEVMLDSVNSNLDSVSKSKDAFNWKKWEKPTGGRYIYLGELLKYVAKGHVAIDASYGDLNEDGMLDLVIVTAPANEDSLRLNSHNLSRQLLIFLRQKNDSFKLAVRNTKAIPCINCCGTTDPYAGHTALTGRLIINKYCTNDFKSLSEYRFQYVSKFNDWFLDTIVTETYPLHSENYSLDTITKKDFGNVSLKAFVMRDGTD